MSGDLVRSFDTVGNPGRARPVDEGWLIPETARPSGGLQSAFEWLDPDGESLESLAPIASHSAGDGAFDLAWYDQTLFVAHCEKRKNKIT